MTDAPTPGMPADDFDGYSLSDLADYLDRGREPFDERIEGSPACRIALAGLERLRAAAGPLLEQDSAGAPAEERWVDEVLSRISLESRAGRRFPLPGLPLGTQAVVTEGAMRGLVRAVCDSVPGVLTGRVRLTPDEAAGLIDLAVDVNLIYGVPVEEAADVIRRRLTDLVPQQSPFTVRRIDLRVTDVLERER